MAKQGAAGSVDRIWLGPAIGLATLVVLGAAYFVLSHPRTKPAPVHFLLQLTTDQIAALEFHAHGKSLTLYQNVGQNGQTTWTIGSPKGGQADQSLVQSFVSQLVTLKPTRTLTKTPSAADLASYGLAPADSILLIDRTNGQPQMELDVGAQSPVGDSYARVGGDPAVYMIGGMLAGEVTADPSAWLPAPSSTSNGAPAPSGTASTGAAGPSTAATPSSTAASSSAAASSASSGQ